MVSRPVIEPAACVSDCLTGCEVLGVKIIF